MQGMTVRTVVVKRDLGEERKTREGDLGEGMADKREVWVIYPAGIKMGTKARFVKYRRSIMQVQKRISPHPIRAQER